MERTGHRDVRSLQKYERPDESTKVAISKALECGSDSFHPTSQPALVVPKGEDNKEKEKECNPRKKLCQDFTSALPRDGNIQFHNCNFYFK